ncbi:MAG: hypothetical protein FRX49_02591 [Trebouxia sp. A1-2]|nr:MAG: hypothetical protein FRX49_02591 [Trebouxia sp. A1-2]
MVVASSFPIIPPMGASHIETDTVAGAACGAGVTNSAACAPCGMFWGGSGLPSAKTGLPPSAALTEKPGEAAGLGLLPSALWAGLLPPALEAGQQPTDCDSHAFSTTVQQVSEDAAALVVLTSPDCLVRSKLQVEEGEGEEKERSPEEEKERMRRRKRKRRGEEREERRGEERRGEEREERRGEERRGEERRRPDYAFRLQYE